MAVASTSVSPCGDLAPRTRAAAGRLDGNASISVRGASSAGGDWASGGGGGCLRFRERLGPRQGPRPCRTRAPAGGCPKRPPIVRRPSWQHLPVPRSGPSCRGEGVARPSRHRKGRGSDGRQGSGEAGPDVIRPGRRRKGGSSDGASPSHEWARTTQSTRTLGPSDRVRIAQVRWGLLCRNRADFRRAATGSRWGRPKDAPSPRLSVKVACSRRRARAPHSAREGAGHNRTTSWAG